MIGTLRETELHAALKRHYARSGDRLEAEVEGYIVDIERDDELVEIQTHNFAAMKRKLNRLLERHAVRLVYPIAQARWIIRVSADQHTPIGQRKSPQRGVLEDIFLELVSLPELIAHPRFTLEVVLIHEAEVRCPRASKRWRRDWRVCNRRLLGVLESIAFAEPLDFRRFIPPDLSLPFTSHTLAAALHRPDYLAHKMTYCLRKMGVLTIVGKRQRARLYAPLDSTTVEGDI
jgi:hypothetical protein